MAAARPNSYSALRGKLAASFKKARELTRDKRDERRIAGALKQLDVLEKERRAQGLYPDSYAGRSGKRRAAKQDRYMAAMMNPQKEFVLGSRKVILYSNDGTKWDARLYVNQGDTATHTSIRGVKKKYAEEWAKKTLAGWAKENPDVIDQAAKTGMDLYGSMFVIPSAVLDQSIKTGLSLKDAVKKKLLNPVTDRALRYRANATPPEGPEQCCFCGSKTSIDVGHVDGHEENNEPENLIWICRSCNVTMANVMRNAGMGRLTKQYNPKGATTVGEWAQAVGAITPHHYPYRNEGLRGGSTMPVAQAVAIIRATSPGMRSRFAAQLGKHKGSRRNPENLAAHFFKKFHGRNSEEEIVVETSVHFHEWLGTLGILAACVVDTPSGLRATITFDEKDAPWLCSNEDGTQLFIEAGNQELDLKALGFTGHELTKERIVVGEFSKPEPGRRWSLSYQCQKDFDNFEDILYQHDLSEPDEGEPKSHRRIPAYLEYEPLNKLLYITGGDYHIKLPAFQTSPGIEN